MVRLSVAVKLFPATAAINYGQASAPKLNEVIDGRDQPSLRWGNCKTTAAFFSFYDLVSFSLSHPLSIPSGASCSDEWQFFIGHGCYRCLLCCFPIRPNCGRKLRIGSKLSCVGRLSCVHSENLTFDAISSLRYKRSQPPANTTISNFCSSKLSPCTELTP